MTRRRVLLLLLLCSPSCGHTYSKKGIQAHLQRSKKCPVAGARLSARLENCAQKNGVSTNDMYRLPTESNAQQLGTRRRDGGHTRTQVQNSVLDFGMSLPFAHSIVCHNCRKCSHSVSEQQRSQEFAAVDHDEDDEEEYLVE